MSLKGFNPKQVLVPRGAWESVTDRRIGTPSRASYMQNCRIRYGTVRSRAGTEAILPTGSKVTGMFNWITPNERNLVLLQDGLVMKSYDQGTGNAIPLLFPLTTTRAPSFAPLDVWAYFCGYDFRGNGTFQARIFDGVNVETAFRAPPVIAAGGFTASAGSAGQVTQGQHFFGFVYRNITGYAGVPVTVAGTAQMSFTTDAGLRQIDITVTLPPRDDGGQGATGVQAKLLLIATRADNPALWYFIPDDTQTGQIGERDVPLNTPATLHFIFNISDEDIAASLDPAQKNFLLLTQGGDGTGPFNPNFVVAYGQRMCYGAGTTLYVSDINNPQQIAADTNQVRMQNQRSIRAAFQLPGNPNLYITGDRWIGYVTDNGDAPATWGLPIGVSDTIGATFPNCICAATGGNYVWIVSESGVYYFDGQFGGNQLLYLSSGRNQLNQPIGWNRVNWNAAYAIQIQDDVASLKLYVAVPLDGAAECNGLFVIDYRMGKTFETCDLSLDFFTPREFSSIAIVKEPATGQTNLWIGPAAAGQIIHFNADLHNDHGLPIQSIWRSGLVRGQEIIESMVRVGYIDIWARGHAPRAPDGNSTFGLAIIGIDEQTVYTPDLQSVMGVPAELTERPGVQFSAKLDLSQLYNYTVAFQTNDVDAWFELSGFTTWQKGDLTNR